MGLTGGSGPLRRLTAVILPAAEPARTARVDCRRAFRSMLGRRKKVQMKKRGNCSRVQLGRGEIGGCVAAFEESKWSFLGPEAEAVEEEVERSLTVQYLVLGTVRCCHLQPPRKACFALRRGVGVVFGGIALANDSVVT